MPALKFRPWITILPITRKHRPRGRRGAVPNRPGMPTCRRRTRPPPISTPRWPPPRRTTRRGCRRFPRRPQRGGGGRPARGRPCRDRTRGAARPDLARRLPHAECGQRRALCRQGEKCPQAAFLLCAGQRAAAGPHPAHDRGHRVGRDHLDLDRNRGAAARSQSDQAVAAALQRAAARRQVVSLYPDHRRPLGAADPQASRRADAARAVFRAVRLRRRRQPHHHGAAARLSGALLHRRVFRKPHPALPALPDPPLLGALHRRDRFSRLYRAGARGQGFPVRPQPPGEAGTGGRDGKGLRPSSNSKPPRSTATASPRCRRSSRSRASIRAPWRKPTCSPSIRRAAIPASRCSSSAPGRTGATAPIFRARRNPSPRKRCWPRSWRSSTTTSRRRNSSCCRTPSRKASCWPTRSRSRPASRSKSPRPGAARRRN